MRPESDSAATTSRPRSRLSAAEVSNAARAAAQITVAEEQEPLQREQDEAGAVTRRRRVVEPAVERGMRLVAASR